MAYTERHNSVKLNNSNHAICIFAQKLVYEGEEERILSFLDEITFPSSI